MPGHVERRECPRETCPEHAVQNAILDDYKEWRRGLTKSMDALFKHLREKLDTRTFIIAVTLTMTIIIGFAGSQVAIYNELTKIHRKLAVLETKTEHLAEDHKRW